MANAAEYPPSMTYDQQETPQQSVGARDSEKDVEKQGVAVAGDVAPAGLASGETLQRQLKSRHVAMISIGGVIGTGLFVGTAPALANGGPLGILLGYGVMASVVFAVMVALGEAISHIPCSGGHITLAARFFDAPLSFAMGWNYWYNWTIVLPAELSAAAVLVQYWDTDTSHVAAYITVTLFVAVIINFGGTKLYGEMEFWFASIKVITIMGLIILGFVLVGGGGPNHHAIGGENWRDPGPFTQYLGIEGSLGRFLGFWSTLVQSAFSYIGTEIVAIAAGEAKNPKKTIPSAIRKVWIRIIFFYILGVLIIGLLVPSNDPRLALDSGTAAASPFVIAISDAGIKGLPSVINAALLTSAWSAASSDLYTSSRALYGLALNGSAPRIFARTNSKGLPYVAVALGTAFACLSYMSAGSSSAGKVFGWFANMTSVAGLLTWLGICLTYVRFYHGTKVQGIDRRTLAYHAPLQPWLTYYAITLLCLILFFSQFSVFIHGQWNTADFITSYLPIMLFPTIYVAKYAWDRYYRRLPYAAWGRTPLDQLDFVSGSGVEEEEEEPPKNLWEKFWAIVA
ncbi:hypothetical protein JCM1840_002763 [Sporobolomyces johnsonii]